MSELLAYEVALDKLLRLATPLEDEEIAVTDAIGRYIVAPLISQRVQPAADLSAMDGFAVADVNGKEWQVIGESRAGQPYSGTVTSAQAVLISTGAVVPAGTNAILVREIVERTEGSIRLSGDLPEPRDRHIRRRGGDFSKGETIAEEGSEVTPRLLALALTAGVTRVTVKRRPRLAIIQSGDELYDPMQEPVSTESHRLPAANGLMLKAMFAPHLVEASLQPLLPDDPDRLAEEFAKLHDHDIIVTIGGASVGEHDHVGQAFEQIGADLKFGKVAIKPGKPVMVARRAKQLIVGLPGNPVSAFVTAMLFVRPLLLHLAGAEDVEFKPVSMPLGAALPAGGDRREFLRAVEKDGKLYALTEQGSGALHSLAEAQYLIDRPIDDEPRGIGDSVAAYRL
ncbi:molybdopterin-binding protein [Parapontixanthobacter aurantiacus]|uniref:molybdopterin-binding protein n=1 Tax=Parapontixanthobacter aurantiacus TaxID=1463599 RepID=UPI00136DFD75